MNIEKKELPQRQLELIVTLSPEEIKPYLDRAAVKISNEVNIPGFRKGKVPVDVLKKNVGEATIYEEAFYLVVNKTLPQIIIDEKIDFIGQPKVDPEKIAPNNPLVYRAVISLMPNVKLGDYKTLKAKKKTVAVDEEKFKQTLEDLRKMQAKEKVVLREAQKGDKADIDFAIKLAGVVIDGGQGQGVPLVIGEKRFIPGFEDAILGMKAGDEKDFKITFPKDYHQKNLASKETDVHLKVNHIYEIELPEINDAFAEALNFKTAAELKERIRANIKAELEQKEDQRFELEILEEIISKSEFDELPPGLVDAEVDKMLHELKHQVEDSGGSLEDYYKNIKKTEEEVKKGLRSQAEKRLRTALVAKEVAKAEKIVVSDEEVAAELEKMKKVYGHMPEMVKQLDNEDYRNYLRHILENQKVFAKLSGFAIAKEAK